MRGRQIVYPIKARGRKSGKFISEDRVRFRESQG